MEGEVENLKAINSDLLKIKDTEKAAAIVRKHSTAVEAFDCLLKAARQALRPLPGSVREAIYYDARGEEYYPREREDWDDVQLPIENGQLALNADDNGVTVSDKDPKVRRAIEAVDELARWLPEAPADVSEGYEAEYEGATPDLKLRSFWDKHLR